MSHADHIIQPKHISCGFNSLIAISNVQKILIEILDIMLLKYFQRPFNINKHSVLKSIRIQPNIKSWMKLRVVLGKLLIAFEF